MLDAFIRSCRLVKRGGPGLASDDEGLSLGPVVLAKAGSDSAGRRRCRLRPSDDIAQAFRLAYGPLPDRIVERWCRGLAKVAELLARGEDAHARIYAVLLGLPEIPPEGMAKLARASALQKYNPDWESESRVPSKIQAVVNGRMATTRCKSPFAVRAFATDARAAAATG